MRKLKLYLDTSVWNFFYADDAPEKRDITKTFFDSIEEKIYEIFISEVVIREINDAPELKRKALFDLVNKYAPVELETTKEADELTEFYMERGIIPKNKKDDAFHVAIATAHEMDAIITWNFQHLANLRKSELFNGVNLERGYTKRLEMVTPMEVSRDES
ncbi:MAG: type II toxin-antitoxin system VapC family toxin [Elusimicrobiota bacterium]